MYSNNFFFLHFIKFSNFEAASVAFVRVFVTNRRSNCKFLIDLIDWMIVAEDWKFILFEFEAIDHYLLLKIWRFQKNCKVSRFVRFLFVANTKRISSYSGPKSVPETRRLQNWVRSELLVVFCFFFLRKRNLVRVRIIQSI